MAVALFLSFHLVVITCCIVPAASNATITVPIASASFPPSLFPPLKPLLIVVFPRLSLPPLANIKDQSLLLRQQQSLILIVATITTLAKYCAGHHLSHIASYAPRHWLIVVCLVPPSP
jgi:hypothetical protein